MQRDPRRTDGWVGYQAHHTSLGVVPDWLGVCRAVLKVHPGLGKMGVVELACWTVVYLAGVD